MRKRTAILAAAAVAVASISFSARADDNTITPNANTPTNNGNIQNNANAQQAPPVSDADAQSIRERLAQATRDAFGSDSISNLRQDLVPTDGDRIAQATVKSDDLNQLTDQIKKAWQAKYNDDFQPKDQVAALSDIQVLQGDLVNGDQARMAAEQLGPQDQVGPKKGNYAPAPQPNATAAQATAVISSKTDANSVQVPMAQEGIQNKEWRIATPADLSGQQLHDNLVKELTAVRDDQANWPSDENKAFCSVTRHVMAAIETPNPNSTGANNGANPNDVTPQK